MPVMAQGARPPAMVASIRSTTAGASIISPPPQTARRAHAGSPPLPHPLHHR